MFALFIRIHIHIWTVFASPSAVWHLTDVSCWIFQYILFVYQTPRPSHTNYT